LIRGFACLELDLPRRTVAPDDARGQSVTDIEKLTRIIGEPGPLVANKEMFEMDGYFLQYLSLCPFLCISLADAEGYQDVSPRCDPPGFVKALDNRTVLSSEFLTYGEIVRDQRAPDAAAADINADLQNDYKTRLY